MNKKMNILIEAGDINPFFFEGTKNIILMHAKELVKRKHNVIILTRRKSKVTKIKHSKIFEEVEGIKFYRWSNPLNLIFLYKKLIKKEKIEIIHIFSKGLKPLKYIKFLKHFIKRPVIFNSIGLPYSEKDSKDSEKKFIETVKNINLMIMTSNYIFKKTEDFLSSNYIYLPYGIDLNRFKPKKTQKERKIKIACLGPPKKEMLIAFKKINEEFKNILFIFNKKGLEKNELLKKFIEKKKIETKLISELKDISLLLNNINLLIDLHDNEICLGCASPPLLILEAMACETKVISTKMGEISEFLKDNENGFLVEKNNSEQIYKTIKKALNTKIPIGKNARKTIIEKYDIKEIVKKYEKIYRTIINS